MHGGASPGLSLCLASPSTAYLLPLVQRDKEAGLVNLAGSPLSSPLRKELRQAPTCNSGGSVLYTRRVCVLSQPASGVV